MENNYIYELHNKIGKMTEKELKQHELYLKQLADGTLQGPPTGVPSIDKKWNQYYSDSALTSSTPDMCMYDYLYECNKEHLDDYAMDFYGNKITYNEMFKNINNSIESFTNLGIKKGDVVSLGMPFIPETIYAIYALNKLGAVVNMCDPRVPAEKFKDYINGVEQLNGEKSKFLLTLDIVSPKIDRFVNDTELEKVIYVKATNSAPEYKKYLKEIIDTVKGKKTKIDYNNKKNVNYNDFIKTTQQNNEKSNDYEKNSPAIIVYTSGTSGEPKGAVLSNEAFNSMASRISESIINTNRGDKFLLIMPPFIAYGLAIGMHSQLCQGQQLIVVPDFTIDKSKKMVAELLKKHHPQTIMGVPSFVNDMANNRKMQKEDMSYLKNFIVGGDAITTQTEELGNRFLSEHNSKAVITKGWGMTELASCVTYTKNEKTNKLGSVGAPAVNVDVRILDTAGIDFENIDELRECGYNETGEVFTYAPTEMSRYLDEKKQTGVFYKSSDGKTYIRSQDLGKMTEDGTLIIDGRIKRLVIRPDGHNISPFAIENIINADPRVKNSAVVGRAAEGYAEGKWAVAYIELKEEFKNQGIEAEIIENLKECQSQKLPPRDVASFYEFVDAMPLTNIGKIDFKVLETMENERIKDKQR